MKYLRLLSLLAMTVVSATVSAAAQQVAPPSAPQTPQAPHVPLTQQQVTQYHGVQSAFSADGVPIQVICQMYAHRKHLSLIVLPGTPNPPVDAVIANVKGDAVFKGLLSYNGLAMRVQNGTMFIGAPSALDIQFDTGNTRIATIPVSGIDPKVIADNPQYFTTAGTQVWADETHHAIVVRGTPTSIEQLREDIAKFEPTSFVSYDYQLRNGQDPKDAFSMIAQLDPPGGADVIVPDPNNAALLIRGTPDYVTRVRADLAAYVDHPRDAVTYDATIYEVDPDTFNSDRGITLGQAQTAFQAVGTAAVGQVAPPISGQAIIGFPFRGGVNLAVQLSELESQGKASILRRATLIAANGTTSATAYTSDVPFPVTDQYTGVTTIRTVTSGVTFEVTPSIGKDSLITKVSLDYSDIAGSGAQGAPIVVHRQSAVTVPTYGQDEAVVISGLYADDTSDTMTGIPPFNHVFLINPLFKHHQYTHSHSEIVLVLIPHVMNNGPNNHLPVRWPNVPQDILKSGIQPGNGQP